MNWLMENTEVVVMVGIPGSGKTRYANDIALAENILSTDDFWVTDGKYSYDPKRASEAHGWNLRRFMTVLMDGNTNPRTVVVDNTNTRVAEIAPYMAISKALGASARIVVVHCCPAVAVKRQNHGVAPSKVMEMHLRMHASILKLPSWWKVEHLF